MKTQIIENPVPMESLQLPEEIQFFCRRTLNSSDLVCGELTADQFGEFITSDSLEVLVESGEWYASLSVHEGCAFVTGFVTRGKESKGFGVHVRDHFPY